MKTKRNINNIARTAGVPEQNMQQFISDSPWSGYDLIAVLQQDITRPPIFKKKASSSLMKVRTRRLVDTVLALDDNITAV